MARIHATSAFGRDDYTITETLHQGGSTTLLRALRGGDRQPVILEVIDPRLCREEDLRRLRREYEAGRSLDVPAVVRPIALEPIDGMLALVLEDFGGVPLERLLGTPMPIGRFLDLAIRLAGALSELHQAGLVHRDLKPENVLVHPATGEVKLVALGIASRIPREHQPVRPPRLIEGSLPYMSPEQTGRMNRAVDSRSDLYSLGVIFHRMLTGRLPFEARDPLEWIHCHVAREPPSPSTVAPDVPEIVSRIVLRLLAKMADERYQSARGLRHDLERCHAEWKARGRVDPFPLGERDAVDRLRVPQELYGRDQEHAALLAAFERVLSTGKPELLLVSGVSGVGKSSLVHELLRPLARERGLFAEGKFDQYARDIPYSTMVQAFGALAIDLLAGDDEQRASWARAIQEALGANARLVTDLLPSLKLLVGEPPPLPEIPPTELEHAVRRGLCAFARVLTRDGFPLVVFIDDLQWGDSASLSLLEAIVTDPEMRGVLVAGAYRPREVAPSHPLVETIDRVRAARTVVTEVALAPLRAEHVVQLVADTLKASRDEARPLATFIHERTHGNPFFVVQLLAALEDEGLVHFDERDRAWRWDLARISERGESTDVGDLLARKIAALPRAARDALETAACLGSQVPVSLLVAAHGASLEETLGALEEAMVAGLVVRARDSCSFAHDRVRQATYARIPEERRAAAHLRVGRNLLRRLPRERQEESIFEVVAQLDLGRSLIADPDERTRLAELNLRAGRKASATAAYASASGYFTTGDELLPREAWEPRYELKYALALERARCEWLCGRLDAAARLLPELLRQARSRADLAAAHLLEVSLHTTQGEFAEASRAALRACSSLFGIELPPRPTEAELREAAQRTLANIGDRAIEDLLELPMASDAVARTAVWLLAAALPGAYWTEPNLHDLMCCQIVDLTLAHGTSDGSPHGYVMFGAALGRLFDDWDRAVRLGALGCELVERRGLAAAEGSTYFTAAAFIRFWVQHAREVVPLFRRARRAALERGDMNVACYAANTIAHTRFHAGDPLDELSAEIELQLETARGAAYREIEASLDSLRRTVQRLRGISASDEALPIAPVCRRQLFEVGGEALADLLLGDTAGALRLIRATKALAEAGQDRGLPGEAEYCVATALVLAAHLDQEGLPPEERAQDLATLEACLEQLRRWSLHGPANFRGWHALVAAELARVQGRDLGAMQLCEEAIAAARESAFVHLEAMSYELAAALRRRRGSRTIADAYLREARACYQRWGADGKVKHLDRLYPQIVERRQPAPAVTFSARPDQLDLLSAIKASQTISGEIEIDKLVGSLLQVVLEQGGARRGCLVLERQGASFVEAEASVEAKGIVTRILPSLPMKSSLLVPMSVVDEARQTRQPVIVEDAKASAGRFASDPYFSRHRTRSVLCLPVLRQAELVGLLYLENHYVSDAFTPDRLTALSLLASQAAISVENARLLLGERRARQRSAFLAEAGALLSGSLDYEETLARLGRLCVESLADWCVLDLVEGREVRRVAGACADPAKEPLLEQLRRRHPARWDSPHPASRCLRSGEAILLPEITDDLHRRYTEDDDHFELVCALGTRSGIIVPLVARGQTLGVFTIASATPGRYGQADLELAQELARRAASAIDNARLYREIQRADERKSEFIAVLSHELRNPLAPISAGLQLLRRSPPGSPMAAQARQIMERQTQHLTRLVNDLLDVTRISRGRIELRRARIDLRDVVRSTCGDLEPLFERDALELHLDLPGVPIWLEADETRIAQVLWNLLHNAARFTPAGGSVTVRAAAVGGRAEFSVRDTGSGIAPGVMQRLFEPFAQEEQGLARTQGGLGLGLALAKGLVELHGGSIRARSEGPGRGTEFIVSLPLGA
jgi:predicted ATPase/GAF domain-containing protein